MRKHIVCISCLSILTNAVLAGSTDISQTPLVTPGVSSVKPNIFFVFDNSGSMGWNYAPDWVNDEDYCKSASNEASTFASSSCGDNSLLWNSSDYNLIYYNPAISYTVPYKHDGTQWYVPTGLGAVYSNPFSSSSTSSISAAWNDKKWCNSSGTTCYVNDNYILPATIGGVAYTTASDITTGSYKMVGGTPNAPVVSAATVSAGPHYYVAVPGEYCKTKKLVDCTTTNQPTGDYKFPAKLRWCKTKTATDLTNCQAVKTDVYKYARYPTVLLSYAAGSSAQKATGKFTVNSTISNSSCVTSGGSGNARCTTSLVASGAKCVGRTNVYTVTSVKFGGTEMLESGGPYVFCDNSATQNEFASAIKAKLTAGGFVVTVNNNILSVTAPEGVGYNSASPASAALVLDIKKDGTAVTPFAVTTLFTGGTDSSSGTKTSVPGSWKRINLSDASFGNLYADASGNVTTTSSSAIILDRSNRSDCAAPPNCTQTEEQKNFANWYSYYRTRLLMMKSSVSIAFQSVDSRYRVGFFTTGHDSSNNNLVNIEAFEGTSGNSQKKTWFEKMTGLSTDASTPLRQTLAKAGKTFAGTKVWGASSKDPVMYACQKNFAILSTDGYWNDSNTTGATKNGSGSIGDNDGDGYSGTLADVADYYYKGGTSSGSNLRLLATNYSDGTYKNLTDTGKVPATSSDQNTNQHMTTYTISLGIDGMMQYRDGYQTPASSTEKPDDYEDATKGATVNTATGTCTWQASGTCKWPDPKAESGSLQGSEPPSRIDDLWHAAVNGHGRYYSARDPLALNRGLLDALSSIGTQIGGAAAATTSNPNVTTGDNFVFSSNYMTSDWTGELVRQTIDLNTGVVSSGVDWSAQAKLDAMAYTARTIWTFAGDKTSYRKLFTWGNLNAGGAGCTPPSSEQGCFSQTTIGSLSQMCAVGPLCLSTADKSQAPNENLVNFLRGDRSLEDAGTTLNLYRERKHVLGDIVSAEAAYAGKYLFKYGGSYPSQGTIRTNPSVFVAANDGMVHAFNASNGEERWAYIPSMVLPKLFHLADRNYKDLHEYLIDGTPVLGDVQSGGSWKSILVGGLAGGGAGYYAIDVTDGADPKVLWEFRPSSTCTASGTSAVNGVISDCNLGYSFGNPIISKLPSSGTWVVMVTSGYNNTGTNANGEGYLYVLEAMTGRLLHKVSTGVGDAATPSGLSKIVAWADSPMTDNTALAIYGGDLLGNMWKFDLSSGSPASPELVYNAGKPITAKPALGLVTTSNGTKKRVVFFPTGRLIGQTDLSDTSQQSFFGIWDNGSPSGSLVQSTVTGNATSGRTASVKDSVFESSAKGWYLDFPVTSERGNTDPALAFSTLVFTTNMPTTSDACNPSGFTSWLYNIDYLSGGAVKTDEDTTNTGLTIGTIYSGASTRPNIVVLPTGAIKSITRTSGGNVQNNVADVRIKGSGGTLKRVSWRELVR